MEDKFASNTDVRVICADARDIDFGDLPELAGSRRYKVVANLPYYAGTPIVRSFLEREAQPASLTVMLQREVARDMCATTRQSESVVAGGSDLRRTQETL